MNDALGCFNGARSYGYDSVIVPDRIALVGDDQNAGFITPGLCHLLEWVFGDEKRHVAVLTSLNTLYEKVVGVTVVC